MYIINFLYTCILFFFPHLCVGLLFLVLCPAAVHPSSVVARPSSASTTCSDTTCSHRTCHHTNFSLHLVITQLAHTQLVHHNLSSHILSSQNLLTHNLSTHHLLTHNLLTQNLSSHNLSLWEAWPSLDIHLHFAHWAGSSCQHNKCDERLHAKRRWMSPQVPRLPCKVKVNVSGCACHANEVGCRCVPRLPCQMPRRPREQLRPEPAQCRKCHVSQSEDECQ